MSSENDQSEDSDTNNAGRYKYIIITTNPPPARPPLRRSQNIIDLRT